MVKLTSASVNGDEHIVGLLFPSDFFGRPFAEESRFSYEAATDVTLCLMNKPGFERFLNDHPAVEHEMLKAKLDELEVMEAVEPELGENPADQREYAARIMPYT